MFLGRLRVLYLINSLPQVGPVNVLESLIRGLDRQLVEPHILVLRGEDPSGHDAVFAALGVRVGYLRCSHWELELRTRSVAQRVAGYADEVGAQILHLHGYHPDLIGGLLSEGYVTISTQHNISREDYLLGKGRLLGSYMNARLWRALRKQTALVGITEHVSAFARVQHSSGRIYTIHNGVDTARFAPLEAEERAVLRLRLLPDLPPDAVLWLVCGSLSRRKDPMTALRTFIQLLSVGELTDRDYLLFLGDGPLRAELEREVGKLLEGRILLLGFCSNAEEYMAVADYLIAPSHSEGFGLNVVEALLSGLVPIASCIPAHRELLEGLPRLVGLAFPPSDVYTLGQSMQQARGLRLAEEERRVAATAFSQETMARRYTELYIQLLSEGEASSEGGKQTSKQTL